jgi:hypothetical protein
LSGEQELSAKESLCWTCKHGLCIRETELKSFYGSPDQKEEENIFESAPKNEDEEEIQEVILPSTKLRTTCFWRPDSVENAPPIILSKIEECSRYSKS